MSADPSDLRATNPPYPLEDPIERIILRSMNEGVITLECNGLIHTVNPAALSILGLTEEELRGQEFHRIFGKEPENDDFQQVFRNAIEARSVSKRLETVFKRNDGQVVDLAVSSAFLEVDACEPELQSVVVVFHDITPFKSLERVKRRAVNHLSHEIKTPLAIAEASIASVLERDRPRDETVKRLKRAQRNLERLNAIQSVVEEIFNPPQYKPEPLDAQVYVASVLQRIQEEADHRSVSVEARIEVHQTDRLDPFWLTAALQTLVKNAIENTPDRGTVTVSLKETDSGILLAVEDTGKGILLQDRDFIFEGFLYTQSTEDYSSKRPYAFNAGGKGLELLRLKVVSESGLFDIWFESRRCEYLPTDRTECPGDISLCPHVSSPERCKEAGGTTFFVLFH